jgi:CRISPR-associated endonuclease/helicase Cas3
MASASTQTPSKTGLRAGPLRVDHATAGAIETGKRFGEDIARPLQFVIAGHHAGLANGAEEEEQKRTSLSHRLRASIADYSASRGELERHLPTRLATPGLKGRRGSAGFQAALFTRMLFSCLIDADYLDTERFYERVEKRASQRMAPPALADLKPRLDAYLADLVAKAAGTAVNRERCAILAACRAAAACRPGLFTLTSSPWPTALGATCRPRAGAWIETTSPGQTRRATACRARAGAWIEPSARAATTR